MSVEFPYLPTLALLHPIISPSGRNPSRPSMSHARGLLTPVLVTLVGVGTGKTDLCPPLPFPKNHQLTFLCPGIAIFDPAFKQEKEQKEQEQYVSVQFLKPYLPQATYQPFFLLRQNRRVQRPARPVAGRAKSQDGGGGGERWGCYHDTERYGEVV